MPPSGSLEACFLAFSPELEPLSHQWVHPAKNQGAPLMDNCLIVYPIVALGERGFVSQEHGAEDGLRALRVIFATSVGVGCILRPLLS